MKTRYTLVLLAALSLLFLPGRAVADHQSLILGNVISSSDPGISNGAECPFTHYHGNLNGVADPDGAGCGHGRVFTIFLHGDEDGVDEIPIEIVSLSLQGIGGEDVLRISCSNPAPNVETFGDAFLGGDADLIFTDGFESGDVSAWSATVPRTVLRSPAQLLPAPGAPDATIIAQEQEERGLCDRFLDFFRDRPDAEDWVDAGVQGATGGFSPVIVADSVDIVVEAAPSIKAKVDNINAYTQQYGPLIRTKPKPPPGPTLSQRFWRGAARIIFFWD